MLYLWLLEITKVRIRSSQNYSFKADRRVNHHLVEWAIALHGMYKSALVFISIFKQKNLYIMGCVQCIWDITAYFLLP